MTADQAGAAAALVAHVITISRGVAFHGPVWKWSCACGAGESGYYEPTVAERVDLWRSALHPDCVLCAEGGTPADHALGDS